MKAKNILLSGILGVALAGVVLTGCHKDSTAPSNNGNSSSTDYTAAEDDANATYTANDAKNVSDAAMQSSGHALSHHSLSNFNAYYNANIVWARDTTHGNGDTLYIIFPATPTKCGDGRYRAGEIIVYWPYEPNRYYWQAYFDSSVTITELFRGYAVGDASNNMNVVSGTRTWTNEGQNQNGYENWNFTANLSIAYANNGGTATWNSTRNNVLAEVNGAWYYEITGSAAGINRKGNAYSLTITSPLYVTALPWWLGGCAWIEAGTIYVNLPNLQNANISVSFGNVGTCDDVAVATINNTNHIFYMW